MFTGLIEDVGRVASSVLNKQSAVLTVETGLALREIPLGASIAVNGACLTVVRKGKRSVAFDVSPETMERTSLATVEPGTLLNLERSMRLKDRLGGHLVTGHIDGVGIVRSVQRKGDFTFVSFRIAQSLGSLLVSKGSVAVDGISLTVNRCNAREFSVAIIPFTFQNTNLRARRVGDKVNIEADLIGKYVHHFVTQRTQNPL
ncbi:MAG TPA: riboflavin synthase [Candidatus Binatia bacterium]